MSMHEVELGFIFLKSTLSADSQLTGYAVGGVWRDMAPPLTPVPFIVIAHQAGSDITTMNGFRIMDDLLYQVKAVGPTSMSLQLAYAASRIDELLGGTTAGPVSGPIVFQSVIIGQMLACYREFPLTLSEPSKAGELWLNEGGVYRSIIQQVS